MINCALPKYFVPGGDQWRYIEHRFKKETGRSYHLVQVDQSEYLEKIFNAAKEGGTVTKLAATISNNDNLPDGSQVSVEEAMDFIHELINNQVLVNELEPSVTG